MITRTSVLFFLLCNLLDIGSVQSQQGCRIKRKKFLFKGKEIDCKTVFAMSPAKQQRLCQNSSRVLEHCPGLCDRMRCPCTNNPYAFAWRKDRKTKEDKLMTCKKLQKMPEERQIQRCQSNLIAKNCPGVCSDESICPKNTDNSENPKIVEPPEKDSSSTDDVIVIGRRICGLMEGEDRSSDKQTEWDMLQGLPSDVAREELERLYGEGTCDIVVVQKGSPIDRMYDSNRIRLFVDEDDVVIDVPYIG